MRRIACCGITLGLALAACLPSGADDAGPPGVDHAATDAGSAPAKCSASGGACQTSHDCCDGTCGPYFTCLPFPEAIQGVGCAPVTAVCDAGSDCCSGQCNALGYCANGFPVRCGTDADCPYATTCQVCIHECVYPAFAGCDSQAPCACGFSCVGGSCVSVVVDAGTSSCLSDVDCAAGMECNPLMRACQYSMCSNPSGFALADGGATAPVPCTPELNSSSCPEGFSCIPYDGNTVCLRPCVTNPNCPQGQLCTDIGGASVCAASCSTNCATDADCPSNTPRCEDGSCVHAGC